MYIISRRRAAEMYRVATHRVSLLPSLSQHNEMRLGGPTPCGPTPRRCYLKGPLVKPDDVWSQMLHRAGYDLKRWLSVGGCGDYLFHSSSTLAIAGHHLCLEH